MKEILRILPSRLWQKIEQNSDFIEEIRIRENQPTYIRVAGKMKKLDDFRTNSSEIREILQKSMEFSVHSYINELKNGFLTIKHGHRIGVCGQAVFKDGQITNFKEISSLNIRVAREKIDFDSKILEGIEEKNLLIISPPNYGKTTLLREICKYLSSKSYNLSVIDERFEISKRTDLGENIDVLLGVCKKEGAFLMLKSMSPDYIILDEITTDTALLSEISNCGVHYIATIHARNLEEISKRKKHILQHFNMFIEIYFEQNVRKYALKGSDSVV